MVLDLEAGGASSGRTLSHYRARLAQWLVVVGPILSLGWAAAPFGLNVQQTVGIRMTGGLVNA